MEKDRPFKEPLSFDNVPQFERELIAYARSKHPLLTESIRNRANFAPPEPPGANNDIAAMERYKLAIRDHQLYLQETQSLVYLLIRSLCADLTHRVHNDPEARQLIERNNLGGLWNFIVESTRRIAGGNAIGNISKLLSFKITSGRNLHTDHTAFIDIISTIEAQYEGNEGKAQLWEDLKKHRYVMAFREALEFQNFLDQNIIVQPNYPNIEELYALLTRQLDAKRHIEQRNGESVANAATSGPCFNCGGTHYAKDCPHKTINESSKHSGPKSRGFSTASVGSPRGIPQSQRAAGPSTHTQHRIKSHSHSYPKASFKHRLRRRPRRQLVNLIRSAVDVEEPTLNRAYLMDVIESDDAEVVEYWEDSLGWSVDAEYEVESHDVEYNEENIDNGSVESGSEEEITVANHSSQAYMAYPFDMPRGKSGFHDKSKNH